MKRRLAIGAALTLVALAPTLTFAVALQTIVPSDCNGLGGCTSICDLATLAQNLLDDGIFIAIFLSAILFAWAGWKMVTASSAGDAAEVATAKRIVWNVTAGLVLIIAAWLIVNVIMAALTNSTTWNNLCGTGGTTSMAQAEMLE